MYRCINQRIKFVDVDVVVVVVVVVVVAVVVVIIVSALWKDIKFAHQSPPRNHEMG